MAGWCTACLLAAAAAATTGLAVSGQAAGAQGPEERAVKAPLAVSSLLIDVAAREGRLVAVGERGHILVSVDRGASWTQADVPTRAQLTGVFMHDDRLGWAVGHDEVILRTRDGGTTWERVHFAPENERPLLDVWFANATSGMAVGAYGTVLATRDGGDTWARTTAHGEDDFHLNRITAATDGTLYLAAEGGHLYRSDNSGAAWLPLPSPYEGSFFGVLPQRDGTILAYGLRGHLFRSPDRGDTWQPIDTGSEETLVAALGLEAGRVVVAGMAGTLIWLDGTTARKEELPGRKAIAALAPGADGALLLFGEGGVQRVVIPR